MQLNEIVKSLTLIHRRDVFRGSPATVNKVMDLVDKKEIKFNMGTIKKMTEDVVGEDVSKEESKEKKID